MGTWTSAWLSKLADLSGIGVLGALGGHGLVFDNNINCWCVSQNGQTTTSFFSLVFFWDTLLIKVQRASVCLGKELAAVVLKVIVSQ